MVMLQKVWWKEYSQVHAEYFYFSPVAFPFLRIAGRLEYCYLYILCVSRTYVYFDFDESGKIQMNLIRFQIVSRAPRCRLLLMEFQQRAKPT